jgi:cytochrome c peroxidase
MNPVSYRLIGLIAVLALCCLPSTAQTLTPIEKLGKELFFDNISQPAASMSCASCHTPSAGWVGGIAGNNIHGGVYRGAVPTRFGNRKPPTSAYSTYAPIFHLDEGTGEFVGGVFWDGRATGHKLGNPAADQALGPFLNPVEQNMPSARAVCEHVAKSKYASLFNQVWGPGSLDCSDTGYAATYDKIGLSIAAYEGSEEVSPFSSKFDAYWKACRAAGNSAEECGLADGLKNNLDPGGILTMQEFDGLIEFGEYCSACHISHKEGPGGRPPLFTDFGFDNVGVPRNPENPFYLMDKVFLDNGQPINPLGAAFVDYGLGGFLRTVPEWEHLAPENDGKFRVPTVRNVDQRPGRGFPKAYMHNGALKSLEEVVHFYNTRDVASENWPPPEVPENVNRELFEGVPMGNFGLDRDAEAAIVAFMKTLNDGWAPKGKDK